MEHDMHTLITTLLPRFDYAITTLPTRPAGPWLSLWRTDERCHVTYTASVGRWEAVVSWQR
jgi:hypothetical protein